MSQMPRWWRKQFLEQKLSYVLNSPLADHASVVAARKAIENKLNQQDRDYEAQQAKEIRKYEAEL